MGSQWGSLTPKPSLVPWFAMGGTLDLDPDRFLLRVFFPGFFFTGDVSLRTGPPPPESHSSCSRSEQASLGHLGDDKIVGCGGFGKYLEKMLEDPKKFTKFFLGQITKKTRGENTVLRLQVWTLADCEWRVAAPGLESHSGTRAARPSGFQFRL